MTEEQAVFPTFFSSSKRDFLEGPRHNSHPPSSTVYKSPDTSLSPASSVLLAGKVCSLVLVHQITCPPKPPPDAAAVEFAPDGVCCSLLLCFHIRFPPVPTLFIRVVHRGSSRHCFSLMWSQGAHFMDSSLTYLPFCSSFLAGISQLSVKLLNLTGPPCIWHYSSFAAGEKYFSLVTCLAWSHTVNHWQKEKENSEAL